MVVDCHHSLRLCCGIVTEWKWVSLPPPPPKKKKKIKEWKKIKESHDPLRTGRQFIQSFITSGPWCEKTCLCGFRQSEIQTSLLSYSDKLENWSFARSKSRYYTFQLVNNKDVDQTAWKGRLVCAFVVCKPPKTGFLASRPILGMPKDSPRYMGPQNVTVRSEKMQAWSCLSKSMTMRVERMELQADLCFPSAHLLIVGIVMFWFKS